MAEEAGSSVTIRLANKIRECVELVVKGAYSAHPVLCASYRCKALMSDLMPGFDPTAVQKAAIVQ